MVSTFGFGFLMAILVILGVTLIVSEMRLQKKINKSQDPSKESPSISQEEYEDLFK